MTKTFEVPGEPRGKARPRFTTIAGHARAVTPRQTAEYENLVRLEFQAQCGNCRFGEGQPVYVLIDSFMAAPQSASRKKLQGMLAHVLRPLKKSDWDNIGKIICDSLNGIAYRDDAQIVDGRVRKYYSLRPRVVITLSDAPIDGTERGGENEREEET